MESHSNYSLVSFVKILSISEASANAKGARIILKNQHLAADQDNGAAIASLALSRWMEEMAITNAQ